MGSLDMGWCLLHGTYSPRVGKKETRKLSMAILEDSLEEARFLGMW